MPRPKRSPVPRLVSDSELARYPGVSLRARTVNGRVMVDVLFRDPRTGKSASLKAGSTREQILACLEDTARSLSAAPIPSGNSSDPKTPFGLIARDWFALAATGAKVGGRAYAPATLDYKADFYVAHVKDVLASRPVGGIKQIHLAQLLARLEDEGVGAPARQKVRALLRNVLSWAKLRGYILFDPSEHLEPVAHTPRDTTEDFFTVDEVQRLIDPALYDSLTAKRKVRHAEHYRVFLMLLLWAGLRVGELAALLWTDCHLSATPGESYIQVRESRDGQHFGPTKTAAGRRRVYIPDELAQELSRHREHQYDYFHANIRRSERKNGCTPPDPNPRGLVFTSPRGNPQNVANFRSRIMLAVCEEAGIDTSGESRRRPHPHTARHTFFTHSGEAGVYLDTLRTVGGHRDSQVTSRYMGLTDAGGKEARDLLEARLNGLE